MKKMHGEPTLHFKDNDELRRYYEMKYVSGGYEGCRMGGFDVSAAYHAARLGFARREVAQAKPKTLLDAGCGDGTLVRKLVGTVPDITAVDIASSAFTGVEQSGIRFMQMNIEKLDFADRTYDAVVCVETLEHVLDPLRALSELRRVLTPGGTLILTYPTINRTLVKRCRLGAHTSISEHLTEWSLEELLARCTEAGLVTGKVEGIAFDFGYLNALKYLGSGTARWLTETSLRIRRWPGNSLFLGLTLQRAH